MANIGFIPSNQKVFETRDGEHFIIFTISHTSGNATLINVPNAAVSCAELPNDITASVGLAKQLTDTSGSNITLTNQTSGASGVGPAWQTGDAVKQVTINTDATTGTYRIVVRCIGSAGGLGGSNNLGL